MYACFANPQGAPLDRFAQENVLVSKDGEALLADFGLSTVINKAENETPTATEIRVQGTVPFSSPELLKDAAYDNAHEPEPRKRSKTVASDVYAYGMLVLQVRAMRHCRSLLNDFRRTQARGLGLR